MALHEAPPKVIQIAVRRERLIALLNDGTMWELNEFSSTWKRIQPVPGTSC